jgi:hypothetical protein
MLARPSASTRLTGTQSSSFIWQTLSGSPKVKSTTWIDITVGISIVIAVIFIAVFVSALVSLFAVMPRNFLYSVSMPIPQTIDVTALLASLVFICIIIHIFSREIYSKKLHVWYDYSFNLLSFISVISICYVALSDRSNFYAQSERFRRVSVDIATIDTTKYYNNNCTLGRENFRSFCYSLSRIQRDLGEGTCETINIRQLKLDIDEITPSFWSEFVVYDEIGIADYNAYYNYVTELMFLKNNCIDMLNIGNGFERFIERFSKWNLVVFTASIAAFATAGKLSLITYKAFADDKGA